MNWNPANDSAWYRDTDDSYRHYSGAKLRFLSGKWLAGFGNDPGELQYSDALGFLSNRHKGFWTFGMFDGVFGLAAYKGSYHHYRPVAIDADRDIFAFSVDRGVRFAEFLQSILIRLFFHKATCIACSQKLEKLAFRYSPLFDMEKPRSGLYLVCSCGYPVWQMDRPYYVIAQRRIRENAASWMRKSQLAEAGGRHSVSEVKQLMLLQKGRCIYCNANFSSDKRPSKDHILPVREGGGDWIFNIVMACQSCNSRRYTIPFRTYCKLLSPTQNVRIRRYLRLRIQGINFAHASQEGLLCLQQGLLLHDPKDPRYLDILRTQPRTERNAKRNRVMPSSLVALLKGS